MNLLSGDREPTLRQFSIIDESLAPGQVPSRTTQLFHNGAMVLYQRFSSLDSAVISGCSKPRRPAQEHPIWPT